MFLNLNGQILEIRKKLQHGKDFPVDITRLLKIGENQLEINLLRRPNEEKASNFVIAVEVIEVQHYDRIKDDCCSKRIVLADEVLNSIKSSLNGPGDDDEVAIVDSNVTINLVDPFTNCRPCEVPVRGKYCLHRDCFDLEIFLQTRDRKQPDSPSSVDVWRCPICRGDVRPKSLIVDGFLLEVRKELSMIGQLDTRAIVVDSEGKWKPKPEEKSDDPPTSHSSTPVDNDRTRTTSAPAPHLPSRTPEVIELD
ncbi:Zinc finger MIZ-type protein [Macrophomina phaseolina MS6]|uniref:Zinc finger MIZ-type protein n=2 Tax=Macrophomina phaseolina TaxID=35725 RepID=K2S7X4_MACPH|nr:Zinc finger MIZ-type protein [Macrophomina phaseolina MS6]